MDQSLQNKQISLQNNNNKNPIEGEINSKETNPSIKNKENENKLNSSKIFRLKETQKVKKNYLNALMNNEISKQEQIFRQNFLEKHKLSAEVRVRMVKIIVIKNIKFQVDWMIEVLSSFSCTTHTFFVAVDIMDKFFEKSDQVKSTKDIHLIGVTCMLIASKLEEIIPFKVRTVVQKMTHNKIKNSDILECELEMLSTLDFCFYDTPNLFALIEILLVKLNLHTTPMIDDIFKVVTYISKMILHDYTLISKFQTKYLASSCIYITFKIIEQVCHGFKTKKYVDILKQTLSLKENIFYKSSELILNLAKNFEKVFSFAKNLMKFDSFSLDKKNQYKVNQNGDYELSSSLSKKYNPESKIKTQCSINENTLRPKNNQMNQMVNKVKKSQNDLQKIFTQNKFYLKKNSMNLKTIEN